MKAISRFVGGLLSLVLIALVIIGPIHIAEKLERMETSQSGIVGRDEVISSNETIPTGDYSPYSEYDEDTRIPYPPLWNTGIITSQMYLENEVCYDNDANVILDADGDIDLTSNADHGSSYGHRFHFAMGIHPDQWLTDGIDTVRFYVDLARTYHIYRVYVFGYSTEWSRDYTFTFTKNASHGADAIGERTFWFIFTESELNTIATATTGYAHVILDVSIVIGTHYWGEPVYFQLEVHPDFYIETETTWNNQTITTYEPYIRTITPYAVHKVAMIIGAVLIAGIGWIASPWGEALDGVLPINHQPPRKPRRRTRR